MSRMNRHLIYQTFTRPNRNRDQHQFSLKRKGWEKSLILKQFLSTNLKGNLWRSVPGGTPGNSWRGCAARFFKSWPDFRPKNVIFHTRFRTRPLKSIPIFRPGFRQKLCYHYIDYSANKKIIQIHFQFAYFSFFPYSFGIETINTFIHSIVSSKTISDFRPKWAKCIRPVFRRNSAKTPPDEAAHTCMTYIRDHLPREISLENFFFVDIVAYRVNNRVIRNRIEISCLIKTAKKKYQLL